MIIIIHYQSMSPYQKDDGSYDSLTSWDESPDFMKNKRGQRSPYKNKRGQRSPPKKQKKKEKRKKRKRKKRQERGIATIIYHTCASKQHHVFHIESLLCCHFHILVGIFHSMHTHLVFILSFHTLIALSASVAWQSLLTHININ